MSKKIPFINKVAMALLLLSPILNIYGNPDGWSYGMILSIPLSLLFFLFYLMQNKSVLGKNNPLPIGLLSYFVWWGFLLLVQGSQLPISVIQSYLLFFLIFATFHYDTYIRMYRVFALFCIVFFIFQEVSFYLTGNRISGILRSIPLYDFMSSADLIDFQINADRSCSFFREPAHFAQFLLPLLAIELYNNKPNYLFAILIGGTLLIMRSGNGLAGLLAIIIFSFPYYFKKKGKTKWISAFIFAFVISVVGYYYINSEIGDSVLSRQNELSMTFEGGSASGFLRVWRGFYVYNDYSFLEKIIGCPDNTMQLAHVKASGMLMAENAELYFNAFQKILLNTGIIGLGLFVFVFVRLWRGNTICGRCLLLMLIVLSLMAAIYMTSIMILYLVLANSMKIKESI